MMTNREMAMGFYRVNLHGIGWKVEQGHFSSAVETIDGYIRDLVKAKDFEFASKLRGLREGLKAQRKAGLKKAA